MTEHRRGGCGGRPAGAGGGWWSLSRGELGRCDRGAPRVFLAGRPWPDGGARPPRRRRGGGLRAALWPLSVGYELAARLRVSLYGHGLLARRRLKGTVISVGNLTVGGTGKTPMVLWLAERLIAEGERPAILTRGYRGEAPR